MGGPAVSSGAESQAAASAYVAVRMLLEWRLNWVTSIDDLPIAVGGEVGGPGDDIRVELSGGRTLEVQYRRSLAGQAAVKSTIAEMVAKLQPGSRPELVLLVGPGSSSEVRDVFATDVRNFRQERKDMRSITAAVLAEVEGAAEILSSLTVVTLDIQNDSEAGSQLALTALRQALREPEKAESALALLVREALKLGQRARWERSNVVALLTTNGFQLRPLGRDAPWLEQLDTAKRLNANWRPRTAAGVLDHLAHELEGKPADAEVRRRLHTLRGAAALALGQRPVATQHFTRALDYLKSRDALSTATPEYRGIWCDSQYNYGLMLFLGGDSPGAERVAQDILAIVSQHGHAWSLVALARNSSDIGAPTSVQGHPDFLDAIANIAAQRDDWRCVVETLSPVVATGSSSPNRLIPFGQALLTLASETVAGRERDALLLRSETTAAEIIRILENGELDEALSTAYFVRARARDGLLRTDEALADYDRAAKLAPNDPNSLLRAVQVRMEKGDHSGALSMLTDELVAKVGGLRVQRAMLRHEAEDVDGTMFDLRAAVDELPAVATALSVGTHLTAAEIALELNQIELADRFLASVQSSEGHTNTANFLVLRARLAAARQKWDAAEPDYRGGAALAGADGPTILAEFATSLAKAGRLDRAVEIFDEAGVNRPARTGFSDFIVTLAKARRFDRVLVFFAELEAEAIANGGTTADLPDGLLRATTDVAWRQGDFSFVARLCDALIEKALRTGPPRLELLLDGAIIRAEIGDNSRSSDLVNQALARPGLKSEELMRAANVLLKLGARARARDVAFKAVRGRPSDKTIVGNFIFVMISPTLRPATSADAEGGDDDPIAEPGSDTAGDGPTAPADDDDSDPDIGTDGRTGTVSADSYVRVVTEDRQRRGYFIYDDQPVDARLNEYLISDLAVSDLVGKHVGDVVVRNAGTWHQERLRIDRVLPAVVVVLRRYMRNFSAQFPGDPSFMSFNIGKNPTVESLGPVLAVIHAGAKDKEQSLELYRSTPIPLGILAKRLSLRLVDAAAVIASDSSYRLWTDGPPVYDSQESLEVALAANEVVLTRSALLFIERLGLLDALMDRFRIVVPHSMMSAWEQELKELAAIAAEGRSYLGESQGKPTFNTVPAGARSSSLDASRTLRDRIAKSATVVHRPVSSLTPEDDEWRERLGPESFDAIAIARANAGTLYADDLGLRFVAKHIYAVPSFSTAPLLEVLHAEGRLPETDFDKAAVQLIEWGHDIVSVRPSTIALALAGAGSTMHAGRRVLDRLADPRITAVSAAFVAARGLKLFATAPIQTASFDDVAARVAEILVRDRDPKDIAPLYIRFLKDEFRFLPSELKRAASAMTHAVTERLTIREG